MKKIIIVLALSTLSFSAFAGVKYECVDPGSISFSHSRSEAGSMKKFLEVNIDNDLAASKSFGAFGSTKAFQTHLETAVNYAIKHNKKISINHEITQYNSNENTIEISVNEKCK